MQQETKYHKYAEMLRNTKYKQITGAYSDNDNGRCALGVIAENLGFDANMVYSGELAKIMYSDGLTKIITMNDLGNTFAEIADWLDTIS